mgnify:CR=1 FL=1
MPSAFQFLIGQLKTDEQKWVLKLDIRFQFLIGQLKTVNLLEKAARGYLFQFLIGQLKTFHFYNVQLFLFCVSIPYRTAKNHDADVQKEIMKVFQFLIGQLKTLTS